MVEKEKINILKRFETQKIDTIVTNAISIEGKVTTTGNVRFDCNIKGDIVGESIYIGKDGLVTGSIKCDNIIISGKVNGNITSSGKLHIKETGVVNGDIATNLLSMDEGSAFTGNSTKLTSKIKDIKDVSKESKKESNKEQAQEAKSK